MGSERPNIHGLTTTELRERLAAVGAVADEQSCRRVRAWIVSQGRDDLDAIPRPIAKVVRNAVREHVDLARPEVIDRVEDPVDHSVRYLFRARDGALFEAVRIGLLKEAAFTVCLSSQAGCAMACAFCATGRLGFGRNLTPAEIVGSYCLVRDEAAAIGARITGAVFMGQGEPLHNYEHVIRSAGLLSDPCGGRLDWKSITISTVGLVPQIRRYTAEGHRYKLIVSLTSAIEAKRAELLPVAGRFALTDVRDAIAAHARASGKRMTIAWVLMGGVNDGLDEADALATLFDGVPVRVNLIDVNDTRRDGFRRATPEERARFVDALMARGLPVIRRYSVGRSTDSACGMLAAKRSASATAAT